MTASVHPGFTYQPTRAASRKGAHERTVGHEWTCDKCKRVVHREPLVGMDEETIDEASARHERINKALTEHRENHGETVESTEETE